MILVCPNLFRWLGTWFGNALLLSILISQDLSVLNELVQVVGYIIRGRFLGIFF